MKFNKLFNDIKKFSQETTSISSQVKDIIKSDSAKSAIDFLIKNENIDPDSRQRLEYIIFDNVSPNEIVRYFESDKYSNVNSKLDQLFDLISGLDEQALSLLLNRVYKIPGIDTEQVDNFLLKQKDPYLISNIAKNLTSDPNKFLNRLIELKRISQIESFALDTYDRGVDIAKVIEYIAVYDSSSIYLPKFLISLSKLNYQFPQELANKLFSESLIKTNSFLKFKNLDVYHLVKSKLINDAGNYKFLLPILQDKILSLEQMIKLSIELKDVKALLYSLDAMKSEEISYDTALIQKFIETNGSYDDLYHFAKLAPKQLNFASLKNKYNTLVSKVKGVHNNISNLKGDIEENIQANEGTLERIILDKDSYDTPKPIAFYENKIKLSKQELEFANYLELNKDYFYLNATNFNRIVDSKYIHKYMSYKSKSYIDLYNENFKKDFLTVVKIFEIERDIVDFSKEEKELDNKEIFHICANNSQNIAEYSKFLQKILAGAEIMHNSSVHPNIIINAILNKSFDIEDDSNEELLEVIHQITYDKYTKDIIKDFEENGKSDYISKIEYINTLAERELVNKDKFLENINSIFSLINKFNAREKISWDNNLSALKNLYTDLSIIKDFKTIVKYVKSAKPKDAALENFNLTLSDGFEFKVLKFLDPYTLKVGADTNCCQRVGGEGELAVIDSFINPLAGVVVLYQNNSIISQSYFHYVPEDNGLILDNVEYNKRNLSKINLNITQLTKLYSEYATNLKVKMPDLKYVLCGKGFNKIDNNLFESSKLEEDPRYFESGEKYSDFDEEDCLDLLAPKEILTNMPNPKPIKSEAMDKQNYIIKKSYVRKIAFMSI